MRQKTKLGFAILAAAAALGFAGPAFAQDTGATATASAPADHSWGQLGNAYAGAAFTYEHMESSSPSEWRGFAVDFNQPLRTGLDFNLGYDWAQSENYLLRLTQHELNAGLTAYVLENLPAGTTYFAIAAYNSAGVESSLSGIGSKTI